MFSFNQTYILRTIVSIAVGEPVLEVTAQGRGGRSTHAALLAAQLIADSDDVFAAFATDGAVSLKKLRDCSDAAPLTRPTRISALVIDAETEILNEIQARF